MRMKPSAYEPVCDLTNAMTSGGKKPPSPPAAPTTPVTAPTRSGNHCGDELEDRSGAEPEEDRHRRQAIVSGTMCS